MQNDRNTGSFFGGPQVAVYLLMAANIAVYLLCFRSTGTQAISNEVLLRNGAMYSFAIKRHEYWRLLAYGFLHVNLLHIATNMFCLLFWGGHLEKRVGFLYFAIIYVAALVGGAFASDYQHAPQLFVAVGASGATSGLLGALFALWILGKIDLGANFFVVNIGLNAALSATVPNLDWASHLGGFAAGLIACAILDLVEKANAFFLRCKFPEFVKANLAVALGLAGWMVWSSRTANTALSVEGTALTLAAAAIVLIKLIDLILSLRKGLALVVLALSIANAALVIVAGSLFAPRWPAACPRFDLGGMMIRQWLDAACSNMALATDVAAACACVLTIFLYSQALYRGLTDVGFVGSSLRAARSRNFGI
jgi:membrane associated rhomboid family serine protease